MDISRRNFIKLMAAAPVVAKTSLAMGLVAQLAPEKVAALNQEEIETTQWHLSIIDKGLVVKNRDIPFFERKNPILFSGNIDGDPQIIATRLINRLQASEARVLTVWLMPPMNSNPTLRSIAYYDFNGMRYTA